MTPADLLDHADRLIAPPPNRPRQVDLRRAASAAYYALFHRLTGDAAALFADDPARTAVLRRAYSHQAMLEVAKRIRGGTVPRSLKERLEPSDGLKSVAEAFEELQALRHGADYDLARPFNKADVRAAVDQSRTAIETWAAVAPTDEGRIFLGAFTHWKLWDRERA